MRPAQPPRAAWPPAKPTEEIPPHLLTRYEVDAATGCWLWTGHRDTKGYGRIGYRGRSYAAHRAVYTHLVGLIPDGYVLDHLCRVTSCVRPDHLDPTTARVNQARGDTPTSARTRARLTGTCINGHDIAQVGVHKQRNGWTCAQCGRDRVRAYKKRKQDAQKVAA